MKIKLILISLASLTLAVAVRAQTVETVTTNGLFEPYGVAVDSTTNAYYLTDSANNRVVRYDPANGAVASLAENFLFSPHGIVLARGGLVVAESGRHVIAFVSFDGDRVVLAGSTRGNADGKGSAAQFSSPSGLAVDKAGNIFIADAKNNAIRKMEPDNTVSTYFATGLFEPAGVAVDDTGGIFVADTRNHCIKLIKADKSVEVIAGVEGIGGDSSGLFNGPRGVIWVGGETGLLVSDSGNDVIRRVYFKAGSWRTAIYAGALGEVGFVNGDLTTAQFNSPLGLAINLEGNILIADLYNNALRVIKRVVVPAPDVFPTSGNYSNSISLVVTSSLPNAILRYTTDGSDPNPLSAVATGLLTFTGGPVPLKVRGFSPDFATSTTVSNNYSFFVNPLFISFAGGSFTNDVDLKIFTLTEGAKIFYTTDGNIPTTNSQPWTDRMFGLSGPFQARAFRDGFEPSPIVGGVFTFNVSDPVVDPAGATTNNGVQISIISGTEGAKLYWTIDGSQPAADNPKATLYAGPFFLGTNGVFQVKGFKPGYVSTRTFSAVFNLAVANPVISPADVSTNNAIVVTLSTETTGAKIYYTTDGTEPTTGSTLYAAPFQVDKTGTLKVKGFKDGFEPSATVVSAFNFTVAIPIILPNGAVANNPVEVTLTTDTTGVQLYWTINGKDPTINDAAYRGPFILGTNGTLKVKGFRDGFAPSQIVSAEFKLSTADPTITPPGASSNNPVTVAFKSATEAAQFYWTIDGNDPLDGKTPIPTSTLYTGPFALGTNGTLKVVAVKNGFVDSQVVSAVFNLNVAVPTLSPEPGTSINSVVVTAASATTGGELRYTTDGATPTASSTLYAGPLTITTNITLRVAAFRNGFITSPVVGGDYKIQVDKPQLSPSSGFFPNGATITLTVSRANATIYYTLNGDDPTPNDNLYTGPFVLNQIFNQGADLRSLKARAFAPDTLPSDIVSGQPVQANGIGAPKDVVGGIGATVVIPVVVNLQSNKVLRSLQFLVEVSPNSPAALPLTRDIRVLNITGNDFVPVIGPADAGATALFNTSSYQSGNIRGVVVSAIGTNANFVVRNFATVAMLAVNVPAGASVDDVYKVEILQPSGTSDGQQNPVPLTALAARTITVKNIKYAVGDSALGTWYNAGDFGNGNLDNSDVNNAFYASLGVRVPYSFSDVFDAMDAFPDDTNGAVGGDGQIRFLDWQRILSRSLRRDANNWQRSWASGGVRLASSATLPSSSPALPAESFSNVSSGLAWLRQALIGALSLENVSPESTVDVPVYVNVKQGENLAGLQFRAAIEGDGPPVEGAQFIPAAGIPNPLSLDGFPANQVVAAWPLVPSPSFDPPLESSNLLGHVRFKVPAGAQTGQCYKLRFLNADGSPNETTQYDLETLAGCIWINTADPKAVDFLSDEWKNNFFGSLNNALADPNIDADGDGMPNGMEFLHGTNPTKLRLHLLDADWRTMKVNGFKLRFFAAQGKRYVVECSPDINAANWTVIASNLVGRGDIKEIIDSNVANRAQFYRVRQQP